MVDKIKNFFAAPVFEDEEKTRIAYLLNFVTWFYLGLAIMGMFSVLGLYGATADTKALMIEVAVRVMPLLTANLLAQILMRQGYVRGASIVFVTLLWMGHTGSMVMNGGIYSTAYAFYFLVILIAGLLLGTRATLIALALSILSGVFFALLEGQGILPDPLSTNPVVEFVVMTFGFSVTTAILYLFLRSLREASERVSATNVQLQEAGESLEMRVTKRTHDLAVAAEIGRALSQVQDVDMLLIQSVNLIQDRYDLYHTQIYLKADSAAGSTLMLRAGTGRLGRRLLESKHQLPITAKSINGLAVLEKRSVVVENTAVSDDFRAHTQLPDTRSELAVPLIIGDHVIGTLDMQSATANAFSEDNLSAFETMGNQLAVAIDNANLFTERQRVQKALRTSEALFGGVINNATAVIYIKQTDGKYMLVNRRYEELFNISNEEINGKTDHDLFPVDAADALRENDLAVLDQEGTVTSEEEIPHPDGMHTYISVKFPLLDEQGKAYAVAGVSTDITDVKAAEVRLAERVAQLDLLNAIGRKIEKNTPVPEFLEWAAVQIPAAMHHADICTASIQWEGQLYGDPAARQKMRHIIEEMRVQDRHIGYITVAYSDSEYMFVDADSALIGGVGQRIGAYLQTQFLLAQTQAHSEDLRIVTEVGTAVSVILDPQTLMKSAVDIINSKFDLYHVSIFLIDELNQELRLTAGAGERGDALTASNVSIHVGNPYSVIARAARERRFTLLNNVKEDLNFYSHPSLADVASEISVPMQIGDVLWGVLDVQSTEINAFSEEKVVIYTALATQITVALQNARQHERTQITLDEVNALQQAAVREGWRTLSKQDGYLATANGVEVLTENGRLQIDNNEHVIMPMSVRGAQIGNIAVRTDAAGLSEADQELLNSISAQVADALERARFFEEIEQARHHTETLYDIGRILPTIETNSELLRTIADGAAESINANQLLLLLCDVDKERVDHTVAGGVGREKVGLDVDFNDIWNGLSGWTLRERKTAFSPKIVRDERESELAHTYRLNHDVGSLIVVPLIYQDKILGTLTAINQLDQPDFTQAEVDLLTAFGIQATVAIENRNLLDETQKRAGREQTLREITNRVNTAVDAESVLKTAVKEVGRAMGLEIFAYLDDSVSADTENVG